MIFAPYFSAQTQGQTTLAFIKQQKILKYEKNGLILLERQGKVSATSRLFAASSDVKFKRILNRNAIPSIYL